ncbi:sister chromatid cohesion protein Dcc1 [Blastomyces dermatitidis ER-3]|uniref:Sister chromatid cohesion protein Dcc1 n=2 Tax=Ajellomyces dermatitidis (strain ER-3 / ATCC MYA-2586) TaxID=559297 RepID=A0ABX2VXF7_AJEDR|nr:sister chromatid cohesion protein Dcc1 [Blastomyces dermatitidis ER-3]OAT01842.1 sister chromatid cohesion protein Dcc1 [Blastomyces dermatitidis ER-3]
MAKLTGRALDFTHTSPQHALKLVELPPELAELISSGKTGSPLYLKSAPPSSSSAPSSSTDAYVNLCTTTQTYMVRHVHSSNCIYLIQPAPSTQPEPQQATGETPRHHITTIAKCNATLELVKLDSNPYSALPYLQRSLRVYSGTHAEEDADVDMSDAGNGNGTGAVSTAIATETAGDKSSIVQRERRRAITKVFGDVPFSPVECERGWVEVCGFVHKARHSGGGGDDGRLACWSPSAVVKIQTWKNILDGAVLQGINMEKQFLVQDLWRAVRVGDAGFPRPLFDALVRRLMGDPASLGLGEVYEELKWASLDKDTTVSWVGEVYLEANAPDPTMAIGRAEFLESWKDLLPESWRSEATWDNLKSDSHQYPGPASVCYKPRLETQARRTGLKACVKHGNQ